MNRFIISAVLVALSAVLLPYRAVGDCGVLRPADLDGRKEIRTAADLKGCLCATIVGAAMEEVARSIQPDLRFQWFNDYNSATTAFIYFAAAWLLARTLDRLGRRLDPAFGRARKGGVA